MDNYLVQQFTNQLFGSVRSIVDQYGNPWFVGKDVATSLGYVNPGKAIRDNVDIRDRWGNEMDHPSFSNNISNDGGSISDPPSPSITFIDSMGRQQTQYPVWINESGLYSLIFGSRLPSAKEFTHWVTSEVLPMMRKIGYNNATRLLQEENMRMKEYIESCENNVLRSNMREAVVTRELFQIKDKIQKSNLSEELKTYFNTYDDNYKE